MSQSVVDAHGVVCPELLGSRTTVVSKSPVTHKFQVPDRGPGFHVLIDSVSFNLAYKSSVSGVTALGTSPVVLTRPS